MSEQVQKDWIPSEFGEVVTKIEGGGTPSRSEPSFWNGDIPWVTVKDLKGIYLSEAEETITELGLEESSSKLIPRNHLILATRMAVGKAVVFDKDVAINQDLKAAHLTDKMDWRFLLQWYLSKSEQIKSLATGSTVKGIRLDDLKLIPIDIPPLPEQQKIASILTSVDDVIEKTEAQISKLEDLKKGMMQELLTKGIGHTEFKDSPVGRIPKSWGVAPMATLFEFRNGLNTEKGAFGSGSPFLSYKNVYASSEICEKVFATNVEVSDKEIESFSVRYGDVFFTRTSETPDEIGFSSTYLGEDVGAVFNGFCIRGRPRNSLLQPQFTGIAFRSDVVRAQIMRLCKYTTRAGISAESLGQVIVLIPPLEEQEAIALGLGSVQGRISKTMQQAGMQRQLKKSLMQDLLTGKVRVKVS